MNKPRRAKRSPVAHKCGGKCTCQRKPARSAPVVQRLVDMHCANVTGQPFRSAGVEMLLPGVRLSGAALRFVVREAAAQGVPHAVVVAAAMRIFAEWTEAKEARR